MRAFQSSGGGTRTPDTRIMIPGGPPPENRLAFAFSSFHASSPNVARNVSVLAAGSKVLTASSSMESLSKWL